MSTTVTFHIAAAEHLLDGSFALRTALVAVRHKKSLFMVRLARIAGLSRMCNFLAGSTYGNEAFRTSVEMTWSLTLGGFRAEGNHQLVQLFVHYIA